jgi:hypothetical protein
MATSYEPNTLSSLSSLFGVDVGALQQARETKKAKQDISSKYNIQSAIDKMFAPDYGKISAAQKEFSAPNPYANVLASIGLGKEIGFGQQMEQQTQKPLTNYFSSTIGLPDQGEDLGFSSEETPLTQTGLKMKFAQEGVDRADADMAALSQQPLGNVDAENTAQSSKKASNNLMEAYEAAQSTYDPRGGIKIRGSENIRVKSDAYGRPYTVVSMTPSEYHPITESARL